MHRMFILIALAVSVLTGCGALSVPTPVDSAPAPERLVAARIDESVVMIKGYRKETDEYTKEEVYRDTYGTGVVVAPRLVAVNAHSIGEGQVAQRFAVTDVNGTRTVVKVVAIDFRTDVALVAPEDPGKSFDVPAVTLKTEMPEQGTVVRMLARLSGFSMSPVTDVIDAQHEGRIAMKLTSRSGDSGSPVYDAEGNVLGIHYGVGHERLRTYAVPAKHIASLMQTL